MEWLQAASQASAEDIRQAGFDISLVRQLESKGLLQRFEIRSDQLLSDGQAAAPVAPLELNNSQQQALDTITASKGFESFLLDGVTGSGKTEVYMQAMAKVLQAGAQCLLLVPEIGLTPQNLSRFERRFRR